MGSFQRSSSWSLRGCTWKTTVKQKAMDTRRHLDSGERTEQGKIKHRAGKIKHRAGKSTTTETDSFRKIQRSGKSSQEAVEGRQAGLHNDITDQLSKVASKGYLETLYTTTRLLSGRRSNPNSMPVRDKEGKLLICIED